MIIQTDEMVEIVRAYAVKVNCHKPLAVVASISDWVVHALSNFYHAGQVKSLDFSSKGESLDDDVVAMSQDDTKKVLYKMAMQSYPRAEGV